MTTMQTVGWHMIEIGMLGMFVTGVLGIAFKWEYKRLVITLSIISAFLVTGIGLCVSWP
jgi:hypothetical protein